MAKAEEPNTTLNDSPQPGSPPIPKRGAFPTPKAEIESAKQFTPDSDQEGGDQLPTEPVLPACADQKGDS